VEDVRRFALHTTESLKAHRLDPSEPLQPMATHKQGFRQKREAVSLLRRWLWGRLQEPGSAQERELRRLLARAVAGELELLCWCHPLPCHAEVVRGAVLWLAGGGRD
jgi:hypothetical protein